MKKQTLNSHSHLSGEKTPHYKRNIGQKILHLNKLLCNPMWFYM